MPARGPAATLAYLRWRAARPLRALAPRSFQVDQSALEASVGGSIGGVGEGRLAAHFRARRLPAFRFGDDERPAFVALVDDSARLAALAAAEEIAARRFTFRGLPAVTLGVPIDWLHAPGGNVDWRWDLNRQRYFETLGRAYWYSGQERFATTFRDLLREWLAANPARTDGANWGSAFEVAMRLDSWLAAFHHFRAAPALDDETCLAFVRGILAHGRFLAASLEHHVPNNHLLLESRSLLVLGVLFPEFREASTWRALGWRILSREVRAQVCSDGGHAERTPLYHRMIAGELLELVVILERNAIDVPAELVAALEGMIAFEVAMTRPDGSLSLFSDSAQDDSGVRFSPATAGPAWMARPAGSTAPEAGERREVDVWLLGARARPRTIAPPPSRAFPATGYVTMRSGAGVDAALVVFDCGPFGYARMPTHGHADALSFELFARGRTWLTDSGGYNPHLGRAWRDYFRGTRAHNTVVVDGRDQSVLVGTRHVRRAARTVLHDWLSQAGLDLVDASHDGYLRLARPVRHRRRLLTVRADYWLVLDVLTGSGRHPVDVLFHFPPDVAVELDPASGAARASDPRGRAFEVVPAVVEGWSAELALGETDPIQGWVATASGRREPAPTLRYRAVVDVPLWWAALLRPAAPGESPARLSIEAPATALEPLAGLRLRVETAGFVDLLSFGAGGGRPTLEHGPRVAAAR